MTRIKDPKSERRQFVTLLQLGAGKKKFSQFFILFLTISRAVQILHNLRGISGDLTNQFISNIK
jgi:hypothetical protein